MTWCWQVYDWKGILCFSCSRRSESSWDCFKGERILKGSRIVQILLPISFFNFRCWKTESPSKFVCLRVSLSMPVKRLHNLLDEDIIWCVGKFCLINWSEGKDSIFRRKEKILNVAQNWLALLFWHSTPIVLTQICSFIWAAAAVDVRTRFWKELSLHTLFACLESLIFSWASHICIYDPFEPSFFISSRIPTVLVFTLSWHGFTWCTFYMLLWARMIFIRMRWWRTPLIPKLQNLFTTYTHALTNTANAPIVILTWQLIRRIL